MPTLHPVDLTTFSSSSTSDRAASGTRRGAAPCRISPGLHVAEVGPVPVLARQPETSLRLCAIFSARIRLSLHQVLVRLASRRFAYPAASLPKGSGVFARLLVDR